MHRCQAHAQYTAPNSYLAAVCLPVLFCSLCPCSLDQHPSNNCLILFFPSQPDLGLDENTYRPARNNSAYDGGGDPEVHASDLLAACKANETAKVQDFLADGVPPGYSDPESGGWISGVFRVLATQGGNDRVSFFSLSVLFYRIWWCAAYITARSLRHARSSSVFLTSPQHGSNETLSLLRTIPDHTLLTELPSSPQVGLAYTGPSTTATQCLLGL